MNSPTDIRSPCVGICIVGAEGWCIGCYRDREELRAWASAPAAQKLRILEKCRERQVREESGRR